MTDPTPTHTTPTPPQAVADPIREALQRLLAVIKPQYTDPDEIVAVARAIAAACAALAAEPPAPAIAADRAALSQPTAEELQAAYVDWFRDNQGIPPAPTAASTAAAFTLAVLAGEVQ